MITAISAPGSTPQRMEEQKRITLSRFRDLEKKNKARGDDLVILKSKLILLKRLLLSNDAVRQANEILTPPINKY